MSNLPPENSISPEEMSMHIPNQRPPEQSEAVRESCKSAELLKVDEPLPPVEDLNMQSNPPGR